MSPKNRQHPHGGKRKPTEGKKLGRPATGKTKKSIMVNFAPPVLEALDAWAEEKGLSRSEAMNGILRPFLLPGQAPELTPKQSAKLDRDLKNAVDNLKI